MNQRDIARIGEKAFGRMIRPLKRSALETAPFLGFDTEYDSKTRKFLSFQLWHGKRGKLYTGKCTVDRIAEACIDLVGSYEPRFTLVSFFSLAELQFLPVAKEAFDLREYGSGSLDCSFYSEEAGAVLSVFDIARFFDKQSLAKAALSCGLQKLEYDTTRVSAKSLCDPVFKRYAIHDAYLCYEIARQVRKEFHDAGRVDIFDAKTPASASARVFRANHVPENIRNDNNRARYVGMRGDWGGRTETYFRGTLPVVWEYDLSSAYPNAAIGFGVMPTGSDWRSVSTRRQIERCIGGIAHVGFTFPKQTRYPCIPVIEPAAQLYLLNGQAWCTFAELRLAWELGADVHILEAWGYRTGTACLADYMKNLLAARAKATGAKRVALKLQANSLIGKFAQCTDKIDLEDLRECAEREGILLEDLMQMRRDEQLALGIKKTVSVGSVFMPEWNALITGHVRAQLGRAIIVTSAVYSATDAVWTPHKWKNPHEGFSLIRSGSAILVRTRFGAILDGDAASNHIVHHSIWNRKAAGQFLERFAETGNLDDGKYPVFRPRKFRESLKSGKPLGEWVQEFRTASAHWDNKRRLLANGDTEPFTDVNDYRKECENGKR